VNRSTEPALRVTLIVSAIAIALACGSGVAAAQDLGPSPTDRVGAGVPPASAMPELLQDVGLDQRLNAQLPLNLAFKDEQGRTVTLGDYFGKRPVILVLAYYECPMLCTQVLNGLASAIGVLKFSVGQEYEIVTVSFDPRDTPEKARAKKATYIERYNRTGAEAGWHFLTGSSREISALTRAVGFRYAYNASADQFAHASGIMVATPEGRLSHYFYGIEYWPRDIRLALIEAADRKIGSPVDSVVLYCFHYDPASGKYSLAVMTLVRTAGVLTLVVGVAAIVWMRRHERHGVAAARAGLAPVAGRLEER
jgi:protein SCO1/2